ncbi:type VII secretion integral membrane protein EccD [Krasilnikovia cinnamomea]|uniref:Type VII secretion integral membrane protein EccD n=1 Tax=Krasilnikovia cinnamomea TaxID=349313 RepID=A0A4Q7ZSP2_9ACTN|nr:type VII secretion integral membrane protein EccD [Krasilnikovia cinnamomea]RZU53499.1 type VII secretion integral membrane protein EccD [Krasilnikovia cinnamomea]
MTSAPNSDVCRVTVVGPDRRVDLAVPVSSTVADLLPVLRGHAASGDSTDPGQSGTWVLQRLGGPPFDAAGTPESLDWLEGEELFLRPAADPLPELDFDDVADGIATVVNRRADRWRPECRRWLFLTLSAVGLAVLAAVLTDRGPLVVDAAAGLAVSVGLALAAVLVARVLADGTLSLLLAMAACGYAGLTAANLADGVGDAFAVHRGALVAGAGAAAGVALVLLGCRRLRAAALPYPPLVAVPAIAAAVLLVSWLQVAVGMSGPGAAGSASAVLFAVVVLAPTVVLRAARLRGPQLPKTGEELQYDNQPQPAPELSTMADRADNYLSVVVVCAALVLPVLLRMIMAAPGWAGPALVSVLSGALLLRARTFLGVWQRVALTAAGSAGWIMIIFWLSRVASPGWRLTLLVSLVVLIAVLVTAALRPWPRRLLPVWEFTATVLDVVTGLAILPLVLQLIGTYSWARGLFG